MSLKPAIPEGFDDFWRETTAEAHEARLEYNRTPGNAFDLPGFQIELYSFRGIKAQERHGWIAIPDDQAKRAPAFIWIPPYGRESLLPNQYGTREGFVSLSLNFFGHGAFHQEKYKPERGYFAEGVLNPRSWRMREIFQDAVLALRILRDQPEADPERIGAMGMSQGGGISIWLGAFIGWVKAVCADMPFLGGVSQSLGQHVYRYPLKELVDYAAVMGDGLHAVKHTLSYFDTLNVATRCKKPTHVSLGEKDPAVRPASAEAVFQALPERKALSRYSIGHDWYPAMVPNNRNWMVENLPFESE